MKKVTDVYTTTNYSKFKTIEGNRVVNELYVEKLKVAMKKKQLITPIIVNSKFEIIDGQHRYTAISELGKPLYYIVCNDYGLEEVHILNERSNTWKSKDFLIGYSRMGRYSYVKLLEFIEKNSELKLSTNLAVELTKKKNTIISNAMVDFKRGNFEIGDLEKVQKFLDCLSDFKNFEAYNSGNFIKAFLKIYSSEKYKHSLMVNKLKNHVFEKRTSVNMYIEMICDIYNHGLRVDSGQRIYFDGSREISN